MTTWIKLRLKLIVNNYKKILKKTILCVWPIQYTLLQLFEGMAMNLLDIKIHNSISESIYLYLLTLCITSLFEMKSILHTRFNIKDGVVIEVAIGDYIKNMKIYKNAIYTFGVDDRFIMDPSFVVEGSIHYDFLKNYYEEGKDIQNEVDRYILEQYGVDNTNIDALNRKQVAHGSIVNLELNSLSKNNKKRNYIMIAASEVNKKRGAEMKNLDIDYLLEIWNFIDKYKLPERELLFPLIGSSTARTSFTRNDISKRLVDLFFDHLHQNNIRRFIISINDEDYINGNIKIDELCKYIESKITIYNSDHLMKYNTMKKIA